MATTYYVRIRGKVTGPFSLEQLRSLHKRGQFTSFHEVSNNRANWHSVSAFEELGVLFNQDGIGNLGYAEAIQVPIAPAPILSTTPSVEAPRQAQHSIEGWRKSRTGLTLVLASSFTFYSLMIVMGVLFLFHLIMSHSYYSFRGGSPFMATLILIFATLAYWIPRILDTVGFGFTRAVPQESGGKELSVTVFIVSLVCLVCLLLAAIAWLFSLMSGSRNPAAALFAYTSLVLVFLDYLLLSINSFLFLLSLRAQARQLQGARAMQISTTLLIGYVIIVLSTLLFGVFFCSP